MSADGRGRGPMVAVSPAHNAVALWAWGERDSWLRAGATTAVLADGWTDPADHGPSGPRSLSLQAGDVVVFEATAGPVRDRAARPRPASPGPPDRRAPLGRPPLRPGHPRDHLGRGRGLALRPSGQRAWACGHHGAVRCGARQHGPGRGRRGGVRAAVRGHVVLSSSVAHLGLPVPRPRSRGPAPGQDAAQAARGLAPRGGGVAARRRGRRGAERAPPDPAAPSCSARTCSPSSA